MGELYATQDITADINPTRVYFVAYISLETFRLQLEALFIELVGPS